MNNKANPEKYRKLSIAALVTGILTYGNAYLVIKVIWSSIFVNLDWPTAPFFILFWAFSLPIAAIVCGSIDLKRTKAGLFRNKVLKGMDITGITLGSLYFISLFVF